EVVETDEVRANILSSVALWKTEEEQQIAKKECCPAGSVRYAIHHDEANRFNAMAQALLLSLMSMELITYEEYKNYMAAEGGQEHD
ncbi:MAG: hypothetical protein RRY54_06965, partial [Angelakisella sp.]